MAELETPVIDLKYKRGDSRPIIFKLTDSEGDPLDLTGYANAVLAVNTLQHPPDATTEEFKVVGVIDAVPTTGRIAFSPTTTQTNIAIKTYFYDAQVEDAQVPTPGLLTFVEGKFTVTMDKAKD